MPDNLTQRIESTKNMYEPSDTMEIVAKRGPSSLNHEIKEEDGDELASMEQIR